MKPDGRREEGTDEAGVARRGFLRALVGSALAAGVAFVASRAGLTPRAKRRGPKERELCDADLDSPHDLAG